MVYRGRIVAMKSEIAPRFESRAGCLSDLPHASLDKIQYLDRKRAHRSLQLAGIGYHVGRLTRLHHSNRDQAGIDWTFVARDDGLKCLHHLASYGHWIDAVMRHGGVRAFTPDHDLEFTR